MTSHVETRVWVILVENEYQYRYDVSSESCVSLHSPELHEYICILFRERSIVWKKSQIVINDQQGYCNKVEKDRISNDENDDEHNANIDNVDT